MTDDPNAKLTKAIERVTEMADRVGKWVADLKNRLPKPVATTDKAATSAPAQPASPASPAKDKP